VRRILDTPNVRVQGVNLSLNQASHSVTSLLFPTDNNHESDDDDEEEEIKPTPSQPILNSFQIPNPSDNIQSQSFPVVHFGSFIPVTEPMHVPPIPSE
jgi:hypothetical protein